MSKPSLVLVHGSWHSPECLGLLSEELTSHGYKCVPVALPSTQTEDKPPASLADDTAAVRNAVTAELDAGNNVVVVAHSFGGAPTNNGLNGLDEESRKAAGKETAVTSIAFLCALPLPQDMSFIKLLSGSPAPQIHEAHGSFARVKPDPGPAHYFYNDLPAEEAQKWSSKLRSQSLIPYGDETSYAAYNDIQSYYMVCTLDNAIPYQAQLGLVNAANEAGAKIQTEEFVCSHSPFLSIPKETAGFVRRAAGENGV